jgi:hypothetical protein
VAPVGCNWSPSVAIGDTAGGGRESGVRQDFQRAHGGRGVGSETAVVTHCLATKLPAFLKNTLTKKKKSRKICVLKLTETKFNTFNVQIQ